MNKTAAFFLALIFSVNLHAQWDQLMLPDGDPLYGYIESLSLESGTPLFTEGSHKPWSYGETRDQLERINYAALSSSGKELYQKTGDLLASKDRPKDENLLLETDFSIAPSLFYDKAIWGTDLDSSRLVYNSKKRESIITLPFRFSFYDNLAMEATYTFIEEPGEDDKALNFTNVPLNTYDIDWNMPKRAYVSYGKDNWNFTTGRLQNDWGYGYTGNLFLSDSLNFHDTIRARAYGENFGYSFLFLSLENRLSGEQADRLNYDNGLFHGGKYFLTHTLDFNLAGRWHIGLTEGLIFGGYDFTLTPAFFNPMMIYHNWFTNIPAQGNAIHQIEIEYTGIGFRYYFQTVLDQFQAPTEKDEAPFTFGLLTGFSKSRSGEKGRRDWGMEAVWTSPYLYTNTNADYFLTVSGNEYYITGETREVPLGYGEGPDRIVLSLHGKYASTASWETEAELRYTLRGPVTIQSPYPWTVEEADGLDRNRLTPSILTDEQEFRLNWSGKYFWNDDLAVKLRLTPLYLINRMDGEPDTLSLETGITLFYNL